MEKTCGIIVLAAGNSARLGSPKQLLPLQHGNLLQYAVQTALDAGPQPVVAVLGANADVIEPVLSDYKLHIVHNENWQKGISTSIAAGLSALLSLVPSVDAAIFMVCDQPYVTAALLRQIRNSYNKTGKSIVASAYDGIAGTPALFDKAIFPQLMQLQGDTGARKIISANANLLATVPFPMGAMDIDTPGDYLSFKSGDATAS